MSYPSDIFLGANAKYYAFIDSKIAYNPHWDINWSFTYALSGTQHGFATFLTNYIPVTGFPGHYLGYSGSAPLSSYLITESGEYILTQSGEPLLIEPETGTGPNGILAIAFDSTGLFALSTVSRPGVPRSQVRPNSLVIRDQNDNVVVNVQLSALATDFILASSGGFIYQTLRFRYSQAGNKLSIDYKLAESTMFKLLTSVNISLVFPDNYPDVYAGFSFCSPISSNTIVPSTMKLKNFHIQGNTQEENTEQTSFVPLTAASICTSTTGLLYLQPDGVSLYLQPDGSSLFLMPY